MRSDQAAGRLRELPLEVGIDVERPCSEDVDRAWEVMRRFALEPADDVPAEPGGYDDGLFAQYGVYDWTGEQECFELDMTRQFAVPARGQPGLRQVRCTFRFTPTEELRALGDAELDPFEIGLDAFFEHALAMPGLAGVRDAGVAPAELEISCSDV
jgi:hypothetical protein